MRGNTDDVDRGPVSPLASPQGGVRAPAPALLASCRDAWARPMNRGDLMSTTIVFQSCRANPPNWIRRCMRSVHQWSKLRGYHYERIADEQFLNLVPPDYREKCLDHIQPLTDLARLEAAAHLLAEGADTTVWIDADVLIFAPDLFRLPHVEDCAFTREIWLHLPVSGRDPVFRAVNNSISLFRASSTFLPYYRYACLVVASVESQQLEAASVGTTLLTSLHQHVPFQLIRRVGNFSPYVLSELAAKSSRNLSQYNQALQERIFAANLCASYENRNYRDTSIHNTTTVYEEVVELLLATKGRALSPKSAGGIV
jgi:hypothetical protein